MRADFEPRASEKGPAVVWAERLRRLWRTLTRRQSVEEELDDELRFHLEMQVDKLVGQGMSAKEARRQAVLLFGGVEKVKEECREQRLLGPFDELVQDARYGVRMLARTPGFTLAAVATLALAIGANTAIFSVVHGVLLRPLPYAEGDELVYLHHSVREFGVEDARFSIAEVHDLRERLATLEEVVEFHNMAFTMFPAEGEPLRVRTAVVSANFFDVLGVTPQLGRTFLPDDEEPGADAVLVLSHEFWSRRFDSDPDIVGELFEMNDRPHTVVGVLPPIPQFPDENDVYMPTIACPFRAAGQQRTAAGVRGAFRNLAVFGRLAPGVTLDQARAEMAAAAAGFRSRFPDEYGAGSDYTLTANTLRDDLTRAARPMLLMLLGTAGLVLMVGCANVANLSLARVMRRRRELALRAALGAGRGRLLRQVLTESTMLSLLGAAVGLVLAWWVLDLLVAFASRFTTRTAEIGIDGPVLAFTFVVAVVTGIVFGALPAFSSRTDLKARLKESGNPRVGEGSRRRLRGGLIVAQMATSVVLLVGAGLMTRSLVELHRADLGYERDNVLAAELYLDWSNYRDRSAESAFAERLLGELRGMSGVQAAAIANHYPLDGHEYASQRIQVEERPEAVILPQVDYHTVTPGYFELLGIRQVAGRTFSPVDEAGGSAVTVLSESAAARLFPADLPLGQRIWISPENHEEPHWRTVVGVVADTRQEGIDSGPGQDVYLPYAQDGWLGAVLVRTTTDPAAMTDLVRKAVQRVDDRVAVVDVVTLKEAREADLATPRRTTALVGLFAALALLITVTGVAGVISFSVGQRTQEFGLRMALGARRGVVLAMVVRDGLWLVFAGLGAGFVAALLIVGSIDGFLYQVEPTDPMTFVAVAAVLVGAAVTACLGPARRATSIDPVVALKTE